MNLQLVLCVEANRKAKTDNIYIKQTISRFYNIGNNVRLTFINMGGKSNFKAPDVKRQVKQYCQDYKIGATVVLYCIDLDNYETDAEQVSLNKGVTEFAQRNNHEIIWFCRDIEEVYLGRRVDKSEKTKLALEFARKGNIQFVEADKLEHGKESKGTSNILVVLDKYLKRRDI